MTTQTVKSQKSFIAQNEWAKPVITAVLTQLGGGKDALETLLEVRSAGQGVSGFIYYSETHAFAMRHRAKIVAMLEESAESMGEEVVTMVKGFGVFRNNAMDQDDLRDLYKYLGGGKPEQGTVTNVMAWFALEEVARLYQDFCEE